MFGVLAHLMVFDMLTLVLVCLLLEIDLSSQNFYLPLMVLLLNLVTV